MRQWAARGSCGSGQLVDIYCACWCVTARMRVFCQCFLAVLDSKRKRTSEAAEGLGLTAAAAAAAGSEGTRPDVCACDALLEWTQLHLRL
jgi:hypothetical protein